MSDGTKLMTGAQEKKIDYKYFKHSHKKIEELNLLPKHPIIYQSKYICEGSKLGSLLSTVTNTFYVNFLFRHNFVDLRLK